MTDNRDWRLRWHADVLALVSGILLVFAFAPFGAWPLAIVSLSVLYWLIMPARVARAAFRGYLFGVGWFGTGVSWVYVSISLFGNADVLLATTITLLLVLVLSLYPAMATGVSVYLSRRRPVLLAIVLPCSWVVLEWLRGWLFTGFPWLEAGYAMIDTPLAGYAPYVGVSGITLLLLQSAGLLVLAILRSQTRSTRIVAMVCLLVIWLLPALIGPPAQVTAAGGRMDVALIQGNIPQHRKWMPSERIPTLKMYRQLTEQNWDRDIVVWPETAVPAYEDEVLPYIDAMHAAAQLTATTLLTGIVIRETHGQRYYNALVSLGGKDRGPETVYAKRHLVPFGEYLPLKALLDPLLGYLEIPMSDFSAGEQASGLVRTGNLQAGASICFEIVFSNAIRSSVPEAHYLVNISNDAWFGDSLAPHQHLQIARMRALELGRYLLRATNTGISAIIAPDGELAAHTTQFERVVLHGTIRPMQGLTHYARWGHYPVLVFCVVLLVLAGMFARRHS